MSISINWQVIGVEQYIILAILLFIIGIAGIFINRKNIITILMSLELMLLAVNLNFVAFANKLSDLQGQVFTLFILTVAAAEAAIGLAILVICHRQRKDINISTLTEMRG